MTVVLTMIVLMGLVHRDRCGPAKIGWESVLIIVVYLATMVTASLW